MSSYLRDGGGNIIGFKDLNGSPVPVTNNVFASAPAMFAETSAENTVAFLSAAAFTGTGKRTRPLPMIYTGGLWRPFEDYATLFKIQFGTQTTPTMNLAAVGDYPLPTRIVIPGGLLNSDGDTLYTITRTQKHGAIGAAAVQCRMGKNAVSANNSLVFQIAPAATNLGGQTLISEALRTGANTFFTQSNGTLNANHAAGFFADKSTNVDFGVDQYLDYSLTTISAGDSVDLLSIEVVLKTGSYL
ncbi:hypothetical protein [Nitrosomonas sp. Is79A3]|uniref:hypothetical protein n=1 Tax=Nitrosomonas sp. (strain Is79A3) TaxID=261292 RepID=UPI0012E9E916